jgi:myo-inositol-1(or 4)-monophosphatase
VPKLPEFDVSHASTCVELHPSLAMDDRLSVLRFIFDELNINFRCCGSSTLSLFEIAMGGD